MQIREKILAGVLAVTVGGGVVLPKVWDAYQAPLADRTKKIQKIREDLETVEFDRRVAEAKLSKMEAWKKQSLPANPQDAMRLYQQWLTDLAELVAQFRNVAVTPDHLVTPRDGNYVGIRVKITGEATLEQVRAFLYAFYRADLLQHIASMNLENRRRVMPPALTVTITAEGLSVKDAVERGTSLFSRTTLTTDLDGDGKTVTVESSAAFPAEEPFDIRVDGEFLKVVRIDGNRWTVERGVAQFPKSSHRSGATVELAPVNPLTKDRSLSDYDVLIAQNPFAKPVEAVIVETPNQPPVIEAVETVTVAPGQTAAFQVVASDPETPKERLYFSLSENSPQGAMIDPETGQFAWVPDSTVPPGDYRIVVKVSDDGSTPQTTSREVVVKVTEDTAQYVYLTATIFADAQPRAWLRDQASNKKLVLEEGAALQYAGIQGSVDEIGRDYILLGMDGVQWKLRMGNNLRSLVRLVEPASPVSQTPKPSEEAESQTEEPPDKTPQIEKPSMDDDPISQDVPQPAKPETESPKEAPNTAADSPRVDPSPSDPPSPQEPAVEERTNGS